MMAMTGCLAHPQNATPASDVTAAYRWSKDLATFNASGATDGDGTTVIARSWTGEAMRWMRMVNVPAESPYRVKTDLFYRSTVRMPCKRTVIL